MEDISLQWSEYSSFIGRKVSCAMKEQGLTQAGLAAMLGCSQQYVSRIVRGSENLTLETLSRLEMVLGLNIFRYRHFEATQEVLCEPCPSYGLPRSTEELHSAETATRLIATGDRPFKVKCNDGQYYLCKYNSYGRASHALAREYIGSKFAEKWGICNLPLNILKVCNEHLPSDLHFISSAQPMLGRLWADDVIDLNDNDCIAVDTSNNTLITSLTIAVFDLWMANEDRTTNNYNLLYHQSERRIIAIDHAGIFNTSFKAPLMQLGIEDSLLYSRLFEHLTDRHIDSLLPTLRGRFDNAIEACHAINLTFPEEWHINMGDYNGLLGFLFSESWIEATWVNFKYILKSVGLI